jgi:hypothetical protein
MLKIVSLAGALALATAAGAQTAPDTELEFDRKNDRVTKVDGTAAGYDVRGTVNPAQTNVRLRDEDESVRVRLRNGEPLPDPSDIDVNATRINRNVTRYEGTVGDLEVRGVQNPARTNIRARSTARPDAPAKRPKN